eukprot:365530-Chlamydomonas_euryale.AAC.19
MRSNAIIFSVCGRKGPGDSPQPSSTLQLPCPSARQHAPPRGRRHDACRASPHRRSRCIGGSNYRRVQQHARRTARLPSQAGRIDAAVAALLLSWGATGEHQQGGTLHPVRPVAADLPAATATTATPAAHIVLVRVWRRHVRHIVVSRPATLMNPHSQPASIRAPLLRCCFHLQPAPEFCVRVGCDCRQPQRSLSRALRHRSERGTLRILPWRNAPPTATATAPQARRRSPWPLHAVPACLGCAAPRTCTRPQDAPPATVQPRQSTAAHTAAHPMRRAATRWRRQRQRRRSCLAHPPLHARAQAQLRCNPASPVPRNC